MVQPLIQRRGDKGIEPLLLSRNTTHQLQGARIDAGERIKSVEEKVLNPSFLSRERHLS